MKRYFGVIDQSGKTWGVTIPDIAGAVGVGPTLEAAIDSATIALREIAQHMASGGYALPEPSPLPDLLASGEWGSAPATVLIPLLLDAGRTVRANLTFDAGLLEAIDKEAKLRGLTRSAFLASAAREKIGVAGVV